MAETAKEEIEKDKDRKKQGEINSRPDIIAYRGAVCLELYGGVSKYSQ